MLYPLRIILVVLLLINHSEQNSIKRSFGRYKSVQVDFGGASRSWNGAWPDGIRLVNNVDASAVLSRESVYFNTSSDASYPYSASEPIERRLVPPRRTYTWRNEELLISVNMSSLNDPVCTRLIPPITWIANSGSKVKVVHSSISNQQEEENPVISSLPTEFGLFDSPYTESHISRVIEISVKKERAEGSLGSLRKFGFKREDIFRMLDKGPWIMAFDLSKTLPRLFHDLENDLGINQANVVHILSHCPYLIAQYDRYKGRDVSATVRALINVGYDQETLLSDLLRFPSMLAAPPERILGWRHLLSSFNVATATQKISTRAGTSNKIKELEYKARFGSFIRRAPFLFYLNPPQVFDTARSFIPVDAASATASGFVVYDALKVLQMLSNRLRLPDVDKILRTTPDLLLTKADVLEERVRFLLDLLDSTSGLNYEYYRGNYNSGTGNVFFDGILAYHSKVELGDNDEYELDNMKFRDFDFSSDGPVSNSPDLLRAFKGLVLAYPGVLSIEKSKMSSVLYIMLQEGLKPSQILKFVKSYPLVLKINPVSLRGTFYFLRQFCRLSKNDLYSFLSRVPSIVSADVSTLQQKVDYLFKSIGAPPILLQKNPNYLSYDLSSHIILRTELLKAIGKDPLFNGLGFLVSSKDHEFTTGTGIKPELFAKFKEVFKKKYRDPSTVKNDIFKGFRGSSKKSKKSKNFSFKTTDPLEKSLIRDTKVTSSPEIVDNKNTTLSDNR